MALYMLRHSTLSYTPKPYILFWSNQLSEQEFILQYIANTDQKGMLTWYGYEGSSYFLIKELIKYLKRYLKSTSWIFDDELCWWIPNLKFCD